jgi:multidrug efflux pump subunit AcrA (membrane-fusion protein)
LKFGGILQIIVRLVLVLDRLTAAIMARLYALIIVFSVFLLGTAACAPAEGNNNAAAQGAEPTITPIPTAPAVARPTYIVQRGDVQEILEFTGRWQPRDQMPLSFEVGGAVRQVNVQRGDTVVAGQLLADLQITELENQLATAELNLQTAQQSLESGGVTSVGSVADAEIALANARLSLDSTRNGSPWTSLETARIGVEQAKLSLDAAQRTYDDLISHQDSPASSVDSARQSLENAKLSLRNAELSYFSAAQSFNTYQTQILQAENAVIQAELNLEKAKQGGSDPQLLQSVLSAQLSVDQLKADIARSSLYAPIDGEVLEVTIAPGDSVSAFETVITIGRSEPKEAIVSLAFSDVQRLSVGMIGVCQVVNQPDTAVQCIVRRLPLSASEADQTTRVAASLENLPSGQLVEIEMPLQVRSNVLWLPPAAIRTFQNRTFVVLQTPDGPRGVDVELGLQTDERVEIVSGLNEGDVVEGP